MKAFMFKSAMLMMANMFKGGPSPAATWRVGRVKATMWYLQGLKTTRLLFLAMIGTKVCLILFVAALVAFHLAICLYAPWSDEAKMWVTFGAAAIYLAGAYSLVANIFDQKKWVDIFNAQGKIDSLAELSRPAATNGKP